MKIKLYGREDLIEVKKIEFDLCSDGSYDIWYYDKEGNCYHDIQTREEIDCPYTLK